MKFIVAKEVLKNILAVVQSIVEAKIDQASSYVLIDIADKCKITATDFETALVIPFGVIEKSGEGKVCMPAKKLFEIVKEIDGDISFDCSKDNEIKITAGNSRFRFATLSSKEFPGLPRVTKPVNFEMDSSVLGQMIDKTIYAVSGSTSGNFALNGLLFNVWKNGGENADLTVVGTDGHRLAAVTEGLPVTIDDEIRIIVPKKAAASIKRLLHDGVVSVDIGSDRKNVRFKIKGDGGEEVVCVSRLIEGNFPNYRQVIPGNNEKVLNTSRSDLIGGLRRASIMSSESRSVQVDISKEGVSISSTAEIGSANDHVQGEYEGEDLTINFNADYLIDALASITGDGTVITMNDHRSPVLIKGKESDSHLNVVMPKADSKK